MSILDPLRLFVDMDDTLCDYKHQRRMYNIQYPGMQWPQSIPGFFRNMLPINAFDCPPKAYMEKLVEDGHDVWILTRPSVLNLNCYTEKAEWIQGYLGQEWINKLILCTDKSLLKGDILVDDFPWPMFEGKQIMYGKAGYSNWAEVYKAISTGRF